MICQILNVVSNEQHPVDIFEPLHLAHKSALGLLSRKAKSNENDTSRMNLALAEVGFATSSSDDRLLTVSCLNEILCSV